MRSLRLCSAESRGVAATKPGVDIASSNVLVHVGHACFALGQDGCAVVVHHDCGSRAAGVASGVAEVELVLVVVHGLSIPFPD